MDSNLTDPQFIGAVAGAVALLITSGAGALVLVLKAIRETKTEVKSANNKIDDAAVKVVENDRKTDAIATKAEEIHRLANGNLTALQAKLEVAQQEILRLNQEKAVQAEKLSEILYTKFKVDRRVTARKRGQVMDRTPAGFVGAGFVTPPGL